MDEHIEAALQSAVEKLKAGRSIGTTNAEFAERLSKALRAEEVSYTAATIWTDGQATCWFVLPNV